MTRQHEEPVFTEGSPMGEWQPIETAPKDKSEILLYARGKIHAGMWFNDWEEWGVSVPPLNDRDIQTFTGLGPRHFSSGHVADAGPTHWMPLPPPPTEGSDQ